MVVYHDAVGRTRKREEALLEIKGKLRSLVDDMFRGKTLKNEDLDYIISFINLFEWVLIRKFEHNPRVVLNNMHVFSAKLYPYVRNILPVFKFLTLRYPA